MIAIFEVSLVSTETFYLLSRQVNQQIFDAKPQWLPEVSVTLSRSHCTKHLYTKIVLSRNNAKLMKYIQVRLDVGIVIMK